MLKSINYKYAIAAGAWLVLLFLFEKVSGLGKSSWYIWINVSLFVIAFIFFVVLSSYYLFKNRDNYKETLIVVLSSFFFVFVVARGYHGNYWPSIVFGNVFEPMAYDMLLGSEPKTYFTALYSLVQLAGITITPFIVIFINKIISVILVSMTYFLAKKVFKNRIISALVVFTMIVHYCMVWNMVAVSYNIWAVFFIYCTIYFVIKKDSRLTTALSGLSLVLAAYTRYELSFLFGIPFILYVSLYHSKRNYDAYVAVLMLIWMSLVWRWTHFTNDIHTQGIIYDTDSVSLFQIVSNSLSIFRYNLQDMALPSSSVTIFTFLGVIISLIMAFNIIVMVYKGKIKGKKIYLFALFNLFYFVFLMSFNIQGFRSTMRYYMMFYPSEIFVVFYAIYWLTKRYLSIRWSYPIIVSSIVIAFMSSGALTLDFHHINNELPEMDEMTGLKLDKSCLVPKVHANQPIFDYYFGLHTISIGRLPETYDNIASLPKEGTCYYFQENNLSSQDFENIDFDKVKDLMNLCRREVILESSEYTLVQYNCNKKDLILI